MIPASEEFVTLAWSQLLQVTLLIAAVALTARLICRNKPHLTYLLWMLVVLKCLTPPLWSSPTGLFSWMQSEEVTQLAAVETAPSKPTEPLEFEMFDKSLLVADGSVSEEAVITAEPMTLPESLVGIWLFGVVLLAVVVSLKWIHLHGKLKQTTIPVDAELLSLVSRLRQKLGIRRRVQVLLTTEPVGPAVFGFLRPVVVLPQSLLAELSAEAIEPIVAHELVHVRRWDSAAGLMQAVAQLVWWFHPLVWWANRQTSRERERCCDEEVVTGIGCLPTFYARSLLDVLELKRRLRSIFAVPGIRPVEITSIRMEDIMQRSDHFHRRILRWCWGVLLLAATLVLPGAGFMLEADVAASEKAQQRESGSKRASTELKSGGLLYQLPKDGGWVRFDWEFSGKINNRQIATNKNSVTMSSVGQVKVEGETCRWIEFMIVRHPPEQREVSTVVKLLIPEKYLKKGERPLDHVVSGWVKRGDRAAPFSNPQEFGKATPGSPFAREVQMWLTGPLETVKKLDREVVESRLGRLECQGLIGQAEFAFKRLRRGGKLQIKAEYHTRLYEKAPFGVVTCQIGITTTLDGAAFGRGRHTLKLADFGSGAKSALPDKGYEPKKDKEDDSAETKVSTKARPTVTVAKATQTESEDKAVAALKDLGARIRLDAQGRVFHVNLMGKDQITDTDLVHLKRLTELKNLQLAGPGITNAGLKNLRELAKLRRIWLVGTKITDVGLANLAGLTNLEILQFPQSKGISNKGLIHLKNLRKLKKLNLNAPGITDAGLKHLQGLSNLEHLGLDGTRITDAGLEELKDWKHLKELSISYTMVTDTGLRHLRERTDLTSLNVGGPKITNEGLAHLKGLVNLYWLLIAGSQVTDAGLMHLSGITDLQYLWIQKTQISDDGLAHLAEMNKLESLWLFDNAAITDAGLEHLKGLKMLKNLILQNTKVTQAGVDKLKQALPRCKIEYP